MALSRLHPFRRLPLSLRPLRPSSSSSSLLPASLFSNRNADALGCWSDEAPAVAFCRAGSGCRNFMTSSCTISSLLGQSVSISALRGSIQVAELLIHGDGTRSMSSTNVPAGTRKVALKVTMLSPGFVYDPYKPRESISFWKRWFTPSGWRRTKEDMILEMKSAYAITKVRKVAGYSKKLFYQHALVLYKEINSLMANGDTSSLRKVVTEKMFSTLKNELKRRDSMWRSVYWELVEPVVSIRTLRARMIALDKNDLDKAFIQLTVEFVSKQKFEAYDAKGAIVSGDKSKEGFRYRILYLRQLDSVKVLYHTVRLRSIEGNRRTIYIGMSLAHIRVIAVEPLTQFHERLPWNNNIFKYDVSKECILDPLPTMH